MELYNTMICPQCTHFTHSIRNGGRKHDTVGKLGHISRTVLHFDTCTLQPVGKSILDEASMDLDKALSNA